MTQTANPAPMHTSPDKVLLGRYHAREVTSVEIQRRRLDARNAIAVAKKELKKIQADQPPDEALGVDAESARHAPIRDAGSGPGYHYGFSGELGANTNDRRAPILPDAAELAAVADLSDRRAAEVIGSRIIRAG